MKSYFNQMTLAHRMMVKGYLSKVSDAIKSKQGSSIIVSEADANQFLKDADVPLKVTVVDGGLKIESKKH